jgi:DNA (cytosine-5)-methyltransferase 1
MPVRVVELFAGVGGFRLGFEGPPEEANRDKFKVVFSNQWEPSTKRQHAAEIYAERWNMESIGDSETRFRSKVHPDDMFVNEDIATIDANEIPEHDLLCGGFPCQDYSVAKTLDKSAGLEGKKGVLWWEIHRITKHHMPQYLLLENVDRLLGSPRGQRGRDFAVMLASLDDLGYTVEWRVIDASEYGFPQRRKRVFIFATLPETPIKGFDSNQARELIEKTGLFARAFPIHKLEVLSVPTLTLRTNKSDDLADITSNFNKGKQSNISPFSNAGMMVNGKVYTSKSRPNFEGKKSTLGDILLTPRYVDDQFVLSAESLLKEKGWIYLKGGKKEMRKTPQGFEYRYSEGPITFPDDITRASRTIITGEGGKSPSRFKHVVTFKPTKKQRQNLCLDSKEASKVRENLNLKKTEWLRRLTPIELERLNGFPDNHTIGVSETKRAFFMGNALLAGIVSTIASELSQSDF